VNRYDEVCRLANALQEKEKSETPQTEILCYTEIYHEWLPSSPQANQSGISW
jgi:hypothetical protein